MTASTLINYVPGSYPNIKDPSALGKFLTAELQKLNTSITLLNTLMASSNLGHLIGTGTNDNAAVGEVGELINPVVLPGAVSLTSGVAAALNSITLTPGDWLLFSVATFTPGATTSITRAQIGTLNVSGVIPTGQNAWHGMLWPAFVPGALNFSIRTGPQRQLIAAGTTTTIYLNAQVDFTVSTMTAGCNMLAIRRR